MASHDEIHDSISGGVCAHGDLYLGCAAALIGGAVRSKRYQVLPAIQRDAQGDFLPTGGDKSGG